MSRVALSVYSRLTEPTRAALAGSDPFPVIEDIVRALSLVGRRANGLPVRRCRKVDAMVNRIASMTGEPAALIYGRSHEEQLVRARHMVWSACHMEGMSASGIARAFGVHHTSVLHALKKTDRERGLVG